MWWPTELDSLLQSPRYAGALPVEELTDDGQGLIRCPKGECGHSDPVIDGISGFLLAGAPLARPIFPYRLTARGLRRSWMDSPLNPDNCVYRREELLRWSRPDLAGFEVESRGGAWTIHATRPATAAEAA